MKRKNLLYFIISFGIIYLVSLNFYIERISENCGLKSNQKRNKIGIPKLNENWKLDSICSFQNEYRKISKKSNLFENDVYLQIWSNKNPNNLNSFHQKKEIYYKKSPLIWENKILFEIDCFIKLLSKEKYVELTTEFNYQNNKRIFQIDTLKTEYAKLKFEKELEIANKKGIHICGFTTGESLPFKLPNEISKNEKDEILRNWNIKQTTHNTLYIL